MQRLFAGELTDMPLRRRQTCADFRGSRGRWRRPRRGWRDRRRRGRPNRRCATRHRRRAARGRGPIRSRATRPARSSPADRGRDACPPRPRRGDRPDRSCRRRLRHRRQGDRGPDRNYRRCDHTIGKRTEWTIKIGKHIALSTPRNQLA